MKKYETQDDADKVWDAEWRKTGYTAKTLFTQRAFIEGYPIIRKYIPNNTTTILDVGAATGRYSVRFAQDLPQCTVYATDILESSLTIIRGLVREVGVSNVVVQKEDGGRLSFPDNYFDVVYSGMVLQGLLDPHTVVKEMKRVLKPGGVLVITTVNFWNFHTLFKWYLKTFNRPLEYYGHERAYSPKELSSFVMEAGFEVVALDGFQPAYGIYRLKHYWKPAAFVGKVLNRANKIIDLYTKRFLSRHFGFEIVCMGRK